MLLFERNNSQSAFQVLESFSIFIKNSLMRFSRKKKNTDVGRCENTPTPTTQALSTTVKIVPKVATRGQIKDDTLWLCVCQHK